MLLQSTYRADSESLKPSPETQAPSFVSSLRSRLIDWLIDWLLYGTSAQKGYYCQKTLLNKIWSRLIDKYNCVWRNADWPVSWHISTKSYQWQWKCRCSLTLCPGRHSVWMQFNVMPTTQQHQTPWTFKIYGNPHICTHQYTMEKIEYYDYFPVYNINIALTARSDKISLFV